jgi:hypothetical protein
VGSLKLQIETEQRLVVREDEAAAKRTNPDG